MISTADFYGGAVDAPVVSATYNHNTGNTVRVIRAAWAAAPAGGNAINLNPTAVPRESGGPTHYIINDGSVSFDVKYVSTSGTVNLGTVAAGKVMLVLAIINDTSGLTNDGNYYAVVLDKAT